MNIIFTVITLLAFIAISAIVCGTILSINERLKHPPKRSKKDIIDELLG